MFISLWTTRIVLNALGANDFGIYNVVGGAIGMLGFLNASMTVATQRFMNYHKGAGNMEKCKEVFNASILLHFILSVVLVVCLILLGWLFFYVILNIPGDRINAAYVVYGCLIISTAFTVMTVPYDATLNAHENMRYYAIVGVLESLLKLAVAFIVVYVLTDKLVAYGILMACIPLITLTIMRVYCHQKYEECHVSSPRNLNKDLMKEMSRFAGWNFLTSVSSVFTQYGLGLLLNHFYGALLNAAQAIANQLSGMLMAFCNSMLKALSPVITKSVGGGQQQKAILATLLGNKYSYILLAVFAIPCMMEMPIVLKVWIKNIPEWCILFCQLQLFRSIFEQLFITLKTAIAAQGNIKNISIVNCILNILPFALTYIMFANGYAPYMMYIAWILCYSLGGGMAMVYFSKKQCDISYALYFRMVFLPCIVITAAMVQSGALSLFYFESSIYRSAITFFLTTLGLVLSMLMVMSDNEKKIIVSLLKELRNNT
jgi:Na+-driven multidrug efflux pump